MAGKDKDRSKIVDILNIDRADELGAITQYMGHHYEATGMESTAVTGIFRQTAMDEMRHAEMLAQRIIYLGGLPVQKPAPSKRGGKLKAMIKDDLDAENEAIGRYKEHIKLCLDLGDSTTRRMLEDILADEEAHADAWETVLGVKK
jgi:bacterioferritin